MTRKELITRIVRPAHLGRHTGRQRGIHLRGHLKCCLFAYAACEQTLTSISLVLRQVDWQTGDALQPQSFAHLLPEADGVVHTLGTLIENSTYKQAVQRGDLPALFGSLLEVMRGGSGNPLEKKPASEHLKSYEAMNRDAGEDEPYTAGMYSHRVANEGIIYSSPCVRGVHISGFE